MANFKELEFTVSHSHSNLNKAIKALLFFSTSAPFLKGTLPSSVLGLVRLKVAVKNASVLCNDSPNQQHKGRRVRHSV